jgi:hypothetical protein
MRPLNRNNQIQRTNKTENETIKTRTIRYNEQQQNGMKPLKLEQSDTTNSNKTKNETTKTTTIRYNEQQQNQE